MTYSERTNTWISIFLMGASFSIAVVLYSSSWWPSIPYWLVWLVAGICFCIVSVKNSSTINIAEMIMFLAWGGILGFTIVSNSSQGAFEWKVTYLLLFFAVFTTIITQFSSMVKEVRFKTDYHSVSMILGILCLTEIGLWIVSGDYYWHFSIAICLGLFVIISPNFVGMNIRDNLSEIIIGIGLGGLLFKEMHGFIDSDGTMAMTILTLTIVGLVMTYAVSTRTLSLYHREVIVDEE